MPKVYEFATLDDVLCALNEERAIKRHDVRPSLLDATLWQGMVSLSGGYMPHARHYARSKRAVVDGLCESACWAGDRDRAPRSMRADMMAGYAFRYLGDTYEAVQMTVSEVVS